MITITYKEIKVVKGSRKVTIKTVLNDSLDKATKLLEKIGPKPRATENIENRKYILVAVSYDTNSEKKICEPYIYPEHEEEK